MLLTTRNQNFMPSLFNELMNWNNWNCGTYDEHATMPRRKNNHKRLKGTLRIV